jgi:hypothetical protein
MQDLIQMLKWMRPANSATLDLFNEIYLYPVFDEVDDHGNFIHTINNPDGSAPNLLFTAHNDTVHSHDGIQDIVVKDNLITAVNSDCLGADCTTGIWLILEMIRAKIPGVYVIHDSEEVGCVGSRALVKDFPMWLADIDAVISFDRKGDNSVVTHQIGYRTASDEFARSFADALNMPTLKPDSGGVFTDSNEYMDVVKECTNISVGYYNQHTANEVQDLVFLAQLRDALIMADWSKLVFARDPKEAYDRYDSYKSQFDTRFAQGDYEKDQLLYMVQEYPEDIAEYLYNLGFSSDAIAEELGISSSSYLSRFLEQEENERYVG